MTTEREYLEALLTSDPLAFARYFHRRRFGTEYIVAKHHELIADALGRVLRGDCKRLMINIFPRSGKTELAVKHFIAMGFAINPEAKFIHLTYSNELALDNSEAIRDSFINSDDYRAIFPFVKIDQNSTAKNKWFTTAGGGLYAAAAGGPITGFGAGSVDFGILTKKEFGGAIIIDDPLKPDDAFSETTRNSVNRRWFNTIKSRLNSIDTPVVVIGQRLHEDDFCGHILSSEGKEWEVLNIPALFYENGEPRSIWPEKMPASELLKLKEQDSYTFESQYQQNPVALTGTLVPMSEIKTYNPEFVKFDQADYCIMAIDPADTNDYFAAPVCYVRDGYIYIERWICNSRGLNFNIPAVVDLVAEYKPVELRIEGNGGWVQTARDIRELVWSKSPETRVVIFNSNENKEARIEAQAYYLRNRVMFREGWEADPDYAAAIKSITSYISGRKNNKKDDAIDVLAEIIAVTRNSGIL